MSRALFWASGAVIAYIYALFPVLVVLRGLIRPRPVHRAAIEPTVTLLIAARNEAAVLPAKLDNLRALDYPSDKLDVVIASDGSTDATNGILAAARAGLTPRLRVIELPPSGKAAALNAAAGLADGDILVFSDANSMYLPDALRALVRPFADPEVGGVAGNQVYAARQRGDALGERGYWSFDRLLKEFESRAGNAIGGTGAIYAIRRELFRPVPAGVNDDFYETAGVIEQGRRLVFAANAIAVEPPAAGMQLEYGRKVRVVTRAMRCVLAMPRLLDLRRHGFYAIQLWSHKVLRWGMAFPLATLFAASAALAPRSTFHAAAFYGQAALYTLGTLGLVAPRVRAAGGPLVGVPAYFVMVNVAAMRALADVVLGRAVDRWETDARSGATPMAERSPAAVPGPQVPEAR